MTLLRFLLIVLLLNCIDSVHCQTSKLWGLLHTGGDYNGGAIVSLDYKNDNYNNEFDFYRTEGKGVGKSLVEASDGMVYGISNFNLGTIFQYNPTNQEFKTVYYFDAKNAYSPNYGLIEASNGKLYGTTKNEGRYGDGVIFEFDPSNHTLTKLYSFSENSYNTHDGKLMQASNGKLYGLTSRGYNGRGFIYEYDIVTDTYSKIYSFVDGFGPNGHLVEGDTGILYGVTQGGGSDNQGILFEYNTLTNNFKLLLDFVNSPTSRPKTSPLIGSDGKLYGIARNIIYQYDPLTENISFSPPVNDFTTVRGSLIEGPDQKFYFPVDDYDGGAIIRYEWSSKTSSKIYNFYEYNQNNDDYDPKYDFLFLDNQSFLGVSKSGSCFYNALFEFNINSNTYSNLINLNCGYDGALPIGNLVQAANKKFYGCVSFGGKHLRGSIFEYDPIFNTRKTIVDLNESIGLTLEGNLYEYAPNKLLVETKDLGGGSNGMLYSLDVETRKLTLLYDYNEPNNNIYLPVYAPKGLFTKASNGNIYGFTSESVTTVTIIDPNTQNVNTAHPNIVGDYFINGGFVEASNGKLYGSSMRGGKKHYSSYLGHGTILEYDIAQNELSLKAHMYNESMSYPKSNLIKSSITGLIYGTFSEGGSNNTGGFFKYDVLNDSLEKLVEFDSLLHGQSPIGTIVETPEGLIYTFCELGGTFGKGTIVEFDPVDNSLRKVTDLKQELGISPTLGGLVLAEICRPPSLPKLTSQSSFYCTKDSIQIRVDTSSQLNNAKWWSLYNSNGQLIDQNANGIFKFKPFNPISTTFEVRGEGGCILKGKEAKINIEIFPNLEVIDCDPKYTGIAANASFQWLNMDNKPVSIDEKQSTFIAQNNGAYAVEIIQNGCIDTSEVVNSINAEIVENTFKKALIYGPNPTSESLNINLRKCYPATEVRIFRQGGSLMQEILFRDKYNFDVLEKLPPGMYFINIKTNTGKEATLKVIKS